MSSTEGLRRAGFLHTMRRDAWWVQPVLVILGFGAFIVYSTWAAFQGNQVDIALAEAGDLTFVVVLISPAGEEALFYDAIFLPVLSALDRA